MKRLPAHLTRSSLLVAILALAACGDDSASGSSTSTGGSASTGGDAGTSTSTGGATTGGAGGAADDLASLDDEFDDPSTLSNWTLLHEQQGSAAPYDLLDIDTTTPGKLTITPLVSSWYLDDQATFLYKQVTGDFVVEIDVAAYKKGTIAGAPTEVFNSGGLLLRDPASAPGSERWSMYNLGHQETFIGVEGKLTEASQSELILVPTTDRFQGRLRVCRVEGTIHMLRKFPDEAAWTETHTFPGTFPQTPTFPLPDTVQVGIINNAYLVADVRVEVEYIHFRRATTAADCAADLP